MRKYIDAFTVKRYTGIFIILAVVTVFSLIVNVTIAYLGDSDKKENVVKVGYADVSIAETFEEPSTLEMTNTIDKKVQIQNTGTVPAFVRVYAEFADSSIAEHAQINYGTGSNVKTYSWADFKSKLNYEQPSPEVDDSTLVNSGWRYVPAENDTTGLGGYFYYTGALYGAEKTQPLFESVTIDYRKYENGNADVQDSNIDRIQPVEMIIYSELVQTVDTGKTTVTKTGENNQNVTSDVYGYDFDKDYLSGNNDNWQDAWKRFLFKTTENKTQNEVQQTP